MGKRRKALQAEAVKKAKRKKIIIAAVCASAVVITALIILSTLQSGIKTDEDGILDLTPLSVTMLSAEVNRITTRPDDYIGRTIKMSGIYYAVYDGLGDYQHIVAVQETDSCCLPQGLEFILRGDYIYPDDYPENGTRIEIIGVYSRDEGIASPYYLAANDINVLQ